MMTRVGVRGRAWCCMVLQRANEYGSLLRADQKVVATVLDEMPPFQEKESSILSKLEKSKDAITDAVGSRAKRPHGEKPVCAMGVFPVYLCVRVFEWAYLWVCAWACRCVHDLNLFRYMHVRCIRSWPRPIRLVAVDLLLLLQVVP